MYQFMYQQLSLTLCLIWVHVHYSFAEIIFDEWLKPFKQQLCIFFINCLPSSMMSKDFQILVHSIKIFISSTNTEYHADRLQVHINFKYMYLIFFKFERLHAFPKYIMFFTENFYPLVQIQYTNNLSTCKAIIFSINWSNKTQMYIHVPALKLYTI